ncbi:MAG: Glutamyl-tRNA(Gln) amidotransferase subunit A [Chlamydiae bacterium]|nr:Glutamyl-tRNA(Gln) amidotransferase subunit A [Chlamydiota bacterium]
MHKLSAEEIHNKFVNSELSASEITDYFLHRIKKYDGQIGAFLNVFEERALAKAKELDAKRASGQQCGKLAGIPIAMKDNIHVKGEISTCASKFLTNFRAPFHSTVARLLEAEDAIIIGKTNLDEFAMGSSTENSALQQTHNPWNLKCAPGGSSGGSAAAVAARLCPVALGSDTGGSIRQPASLCGIVGFKPTYGRVSRFGLVAFGSSLDQIGALAANTRDAGLIMEVIGQHCERDSTSIPAPAEKYLSTMTGNIQGKRVGVPWKFLEGLKEEPSKVFKRALETLKSLGAEIVEIDLDILKYSLAVYYILATAEASTNLARFDGIRYGVRSPEAKTLDQVYNYSKEAGFGSEVKRRIMLGTFVLSAGYQDAYYKKAQKVRTLMIQHYKKAFEQCDVVAMPTSPSAAFEIGSIKDPLEMYLEDIYTISVNLAGLPGISIPDGFTKENMPFGLQLIGPQKQDVNVLQIANAFEQATEYHKATPPLFEG